MENKLKILVLVFVLALVSTLSIYAATIFNSNTVSYNNNTSGMKSTNVQDAIDELYLAANSDCKLGYSKGETTSNSYTCNKNSEVTTSTINFDSSHVAYDNSNGMIATTVQGAIDELANKLSSRYCIDDYEMENETSTSYTCTQSGIRVTFDANGGTFSNNRTTNVLTNFETTQSQVTVTKYSHTSNVNDTGLKTSDYQHNWTEANITGTDRGDTTKAHVVTIPGASSLTVDIYYNGESTTYDWATVWEGSHPEYTAASNYSSGVTNGTKLGGSQSGSYTVNGNSLTSMGYSQFTISGDSVTFGFKSDVSGYGAGYGYYAIVSGTGITTTQTYNGSYEEPTRDGYVFKGWAIEKGGNVVYTDINEIAVNNTTKLYAVWEPINYTITYNLNNGTITGQPTSYNIETASFTLPRPTRAGGTFSGWTGSNGTTPEVNVTIPKGSTGNKTYTANWILETYTITYNLDGGTASELKTTYNVDDSFTLPTPTKTNYIFIGWTGTGLSSATKSVTVSKGSTGDRTYTALWEVPGPLLTKVKSTATKIDNDFYIYTGASPANYVKFNNQTWRILGVYKDKVKLINIENKLTSQVYNSSTSSNVWSTSTMKTTLNGTYYSGLTQDAKNMIVQGEWNAGAAANNANASTSYTSAKGTKLTTSSLVGTMAAYEYLYAAESSCWSTSGYDYDGGCNQKDWLFIGSRVWTLSPHSAYSYSALGVNSYGYVHTPLVDDFNDVLPAVYLNSSVLITGGDGTTSNPYTLSL